MATFLRPITARLGTQQSGLTPGSAGLGYTVYTWNGTAYAAQGTRTYAGITEVAVGSGVYVAPPITWNDAWLGYTVWDNNGTVLGFEDFWPLSLYGGRLLPTAGNITRGSLDEALTWLLAFLCNDESRSGNAVTLKDQNGASLGTQTYDNIDNPSTRTRS